MLGLDRIANKVMIADNLMVINEVMVEVDIWLFMVYVLIGRISIRESEIIKIVLGRIVRIDWLVIHSKVSLN